MKLPPLPEEAYDGVKEPAVDLSKKEICNHKGVKMVSGSELRCPCGAGWQGANVASLYNLLKNQT